MTLATSDWVGKSIAGGRYRVLGRIGAGSMGHVFRAFDRNLETEVVLKFPIASEQGMPLPNLLERFARETRSLVRLSHPHIVKIIDVGVLDDSPYVVMQYLTGGSLKDRMRAGPHSEARPMPPPSLHDWLLDVARALDFVHAQGHIHRDVKPANILFDAHGHAFLGDFGVIKALSPDDDGAPSGSSLSAPGFLLGTPSYVAPEIVMGGRPGGPSDQYSLALTVHEVLTGRNFLVGPSPSATLVNQTNITPPPLDGLVPRISARLSNAVRRAMSKDPIDRFPTCAAFAQEVLADLPRATDAEQASYHVAPGGLIPCPSCQALIVADMRHKGEEVRCPHCGAISKVIPQDETVQLSIVDLAKDNNAEVSVNPSNVSYTEFSFAERPDAGVLRQPGPTPSPSANVSYTEFSFTDVPRTDASETPLRPVAPSSHNVSYTEFSFADRPQTATSSSSAIPIEPPA